MKRLAPAVFALLLAGCSSPWAPQSVPAPFPLQWPFHPNPAKLVYLRSLTGFAKGGRSVGALITGKGETEEGAFVLPVAVATAEDGRIAVADMGRASVHLFIPAEARYLRLTGPADDGMRTPVGVVFDGERRLWVSDSSGAVFAFAPDGRPLFARHAPFQRPTGLAYSPASKLVFVVDTLAHTVWGLDASGEPVLSFGGRGSEPGKLNFPTHLAWKSPGELFVADSLNFRVQIFDEKGKPLGAFGHHGDGSGDMAMPKGLAVDDDGVVYVADSLFDVVQLFDRRGRFLLTLGRRGTEAGEFWLPSGVFIDTKGELWVCDTYNHRVQVFRVSRRYSDAAR